MGPDCFGDGLLGTSLLEPFTGRAKGQDPEFSVLTTTPLLQATLDSELHKCSHPQGHPNLEIIILSQERSTRLQRPDFHYPKIKSSWEKATHSTSQQRASDVEQLGLSAEESCCPSRQPVFPEPCSYCRLNRQGMTVNLDGHGKSVRAKPATKTKSPVQRGYNHLRALLLPNSS